MCCCFVDSVGYEMELMDMMIAIILSFFPLPWWNFYILSFGFKFLDYVC